MAPTPRPTSTTIDPSEITPVFCRSLRAMRPLLRARVLRAPASHLPSHLLLEADQEDLVADPANRLGAEGTHRLVVFAEQGARLVELRSHEDLADEARPGGAELGGDGHGAR